jgi:hypothetical protein
MALRAIKTAQGHGIAVEVNATYKLIALTAGTDQWGSKAEIALHGGDATVKQLVRLTDESAQGKMIAACVEATTLPTDLIMKKFAYLSDLVFQYIMDSDDDDGPGAEPEAAYVCLPDGLWRKGEQLTNFGAQIIEEITHDDGSGDLRKVFVIEATVAGVTQTCTVAAKDFAAMHWVVELLGARAIIKGEDGFKDATRETIQQCSSAVVLRNVFEHTGWRMINGERCYLHGDGGISARGLRTDVAVELSGSLSRYRLPVPAEGHDLRQAIRASLALKNVWPQHRMMPCQGGAYLAPLRELLEEPPDLTLYVYGPSGCFKTEGAALIQAHWGATFTRTTLPASFLATGNGLERLMFATKDAMLTVDDYFPPRNRREADALDQTAARLLRSQGNGSGRQRMRADTTMRADLPPRGVTLATAERLTDGESTNARTFLVALTHDEAALQETRTRLTRAQGTRARYAQAMSGYIQWIAHHWDHLQGSLSHRFRALRTAAADADQHARQASQIAYLHLAWEVFTQYGVTCGAITPTERQHLCQQSWTTLLPAAHQQSAALTDAKPIQRFCTLVQDGFSSKRLYLENCSGGTPMNPDHWGWISVTRRDRDGEESTEWLRPPGGVLVGYLAPAAIYFIPDAAYRYVVQAAGAGGSVFPVDALTLKKALAEAKLIETVTTKGVVRYAVQKRVGTAKPYVLALTLDALVFTRKNEDTPPEKPDVETPQPVDLLGDYDENTPLVFTVFTNSEGGEGSICISSHTHTEDDDIEDLSLINKKNEDNEDNNNNTRSTPSGNAVFTVQETVKTGEASEGEPKHGGKPACRHPVKKTETDWEGNTIVQCATCRRILPA